MFGSAFRFVRKHLYREKNLNLIAAIVEGMIAAMIGTPATAAGYYSGTIQSVLSYGTGAQGSITGFYVIINGAIGQTPPACATQTAKFGINPTTDAGKAHMATALSALARGATVWIQGAGTCDVWNDTETILFIQSN